MPRPQPTEVETIVSDIDLIVSKSDAEGLVTYANPIFVKISGYTQAQLLDQPHSILRHPDMPKVIFKYLWDNIKQDREVKAYVKNLCKDGSFYWVLATVRAAKNIDGTFRNYVSTRKRVTDSAKSIISSLYAQLLKIENDNGVEASETALNNFLIKNGLIDSDSFNNFMLKLNK